MDLRRAVELQSGITRLDLQSQIVQLAFHQLNAAVKDELISGAAPIALGSDELTGDHRLPQRDLARRGAGDRQPHLGHARNARGIQNVGHRHRRDQPAGLRVEGDREGFAGGEAVARPVGHRLERSPIRSVHGQGQRAGDVLVNPIAGRHPGLRPGVNPREGQGPGRSPQHHDHSQDNAGDPDQPRFELQEPDPHRLPGGPELHQPPAGKKRQGGVDQHLVTHRTHPGNRLPDEI